MNLWVIFVTGLTVGGLTCLAVQGGLLASIITSREEEEIDKGINKKNTILPTLTFLITKLGAYALLGFILGAFGGAVGINQATQVVMQCVAGLYMIAVALNLLNIHPIFRYVVIQPPRFLLKKIKNQSRSADIFAPALLGAMTVFIPCGTTLAMEALAISSGNAFSGAAIMTAFVLGTSPLFFGVGWLTSVLGDNFRASFLKIAALAVLYLGVTSVYGAFVSAGLPIGFQSDTNVANVSENKQDVVITVTSRGYSPDYIKVRKNELVKLTLKSNDAYSCALAFRIPSLGIVKNLQPNGTEVVEFTPTTAGKIAFTCSMGMYTGVIDVI